MQRVSLSRDALRCVALCMRPLDALRAFYRVNSAWWAWCKREICVGRVPLWDKDEGKVVFWTRRLLKGVRVDQFFDIWCCGGCEDGDDYAIRRVEAIDVWIPPYVREKYITTLVFNSPFAHWQSRAYANLDVGLFAQKNPKHPLVMLKSIESKRRPVIEFCVTMGEFYDEPDMLPGAEGRIFLPNPKMPKRLQKRGADE